MVGGRTSEYASDQAFSLGYGVIGNTADSGSVVLGSSPGTPASMSTASVTSPRWAWRRVLVPVIVGLVGGLLSGAFGVGGGIVMVPLLLWLTDLDQRRAAATSLVAIIPTSIVGSITYFANGAVLPVAALIIAAGGLAGSLIGTPLLR